jgi:hypothetical protein
MLPSAQQDSSVAVARHELRAAPGVMDVTVASLYSMQRPWRQRLNCGAFMYLDKVA